jgi:hypothetical protein
MFASVHQNLGTTSTVPSRRPFTRTGRQPTLVEWMTIFDRADEEV